MVRLTSIPARGVPGHTLECPGTDPMSLDSGRPSGAPGEHAGGGRAPDFLGELPDREWSRAWRPELGPTTVLNRRPRVLLADDEEVEERDLQQSTGIR